MVDETINDKEKFYSMYRFTFAYARPLSHKCLDVETAITYWQLVLSKIQDQRIYQWTSFLMDKSIHVIAQDTWNM